MQFSNEKKRAVIAEYLEQGDSGAEIAERHGISVATFYCWARKAGVVRTRTNSLSRRISRDVAEIIRKNPGIGNREIARRLGVSVSTVGSAILHGEREEMS
jgi:transposase-like protein